MYHAHYSAEPHLKALLYFRMHNSSNSFDFSELQLTSENAGPIFKALGGHRLPLSTLILKGTNLGDGAMAELSSSLSLVSTLSELNLSRTGITAQVGKLWWPRKTLPLWPWLSMAVLGPPQLVGSVPSWLATCSER